MPTDNSNRLPVNRKLLTRFFEKIRIDPNISYKGVPCWLWTGKPDKHGYGTFRIAELSGSSAHRMSYQMFVQKLPPWIHGAVGNLCPDHLCRIKLCVNPVHLEAVTNRVNVLRGVGFAAEHAKKTHCPQGHEYTAENTYPLPGKQGRIIGRGCRTCRKYDPAKRREYMRLWAQRRRQKLRVTTIHNDKGAALAPACNKVPQGD